MHVGGEAGKRVGGEAETGEFRWLALGTTAPIGLPAFPLTRLPADLPKPIRPGEERVGEPLEANRSVGSVPTVHDDGIG